MYGALKNTMARRPQPKTDSVLFGPWPSGLVTAVQPEQMKSDQLYEALNIIQIGNGFYRTRDGSSLVCSGCTGEIVQVDDIKVNGTWYTIISDTDNKLYHNDSGTATAIATLEGEAHFFGFMGLLIITDTSYIKAWDGTGIFMLYDDGNGVTAPYQVNKRDLTPTTNKPLGNGTITSVELPFTSQVWDAGYTIPITHVYATMYKVGSPTGSVTAKLTTAGGTVMASKDIITDVENFVTGADGLEYEAIFSASDITTEMSPNTSYKLVLEYSGGDSSSYVMVKAIDSSTPQISVKPSRPPKAAHGIVNKEKMFCIEGVSGTNPGWVHYCARGNHLDWSSENSGGYVGAVDQSATSYPIAGIASWYDDVWIFGTPRQPYLGKLTGDTPNQYIIQKTLQKVSGNQKSIVVTPDDIIFLHPAGVDFVSSIQEYGDVAAVTQTDNIRDQIHSYFSSAAVAGYDPLWGLYCLKMAGTDYTYIIHTRSKTIKTKGKRQYSYSPVTRWKFAFSGGVTAFGSGDGFMYVGTDDGKVYKMDSSAVNDGTDTVEYALISSFVNTVFGEAQARRLNMTSFAQMGADFSFKFYRNHSRTSFFELNSIISAMDSALRTVDADMLTADANFRTLPDSYFDRYNLCFNFKNLMVGVEDISLGRETPMFFGPINMIYSSVGGL